MFSLLLSAASTAPRMTMLGFVVCVIMVLMLYAYWRSTE
jgi:hypothetical protein